MCDSLDNKKEEWVRIWNYPLSDVYCPTLSGNPRGALQEEVKNFPVEGTFFSQCMIYVTTCSAEEQYLSTVFFLSRNGGMDFLDQISYVGNNTELSSLQN